ncbi:hypothetical protein D3C75_1047690 [compost metagenome]
MLGDHHRHIPFLFVRLEGGINQCDSITLVELTRLLVINIGKKRQVRIRINRRRDGNRFAVAAFVYRQACGVQRFHRIAAQLVDLAVGYEANHRQINMNVTRVIKALPQFAQSVTQCDKRFLRLVGGAEFALQRMADADALFADQG